MVRIETDVLVIGSGAAGLQAAVYARKEGVRVLVVDKGFVGRSGSTVGAEGIAGVGHWRHREDSVERHLEDSIVSGAHLNNPALLKVLTGDAQNVLLALEKAGMYFQRDKEGSRFSLGSSGGHSFPRGFGCQDITGKVIVDVLRSEAMRCGVGLKSEFFVSSLVQGKGKGVIGAFGIDSAAGALTLVKAKAMIIATGGVGQLYPFTTNPGQVKGDGMALAFEAGARLIDMEMVQFYPATLFYPESLRGIPTSLQEYGKLYNGNEERFMDRYDPERMEKTTRDILARGIYSEIRAGRAGEHGGVYLDARGLPEEVYDRFQNSIRVYYEKGLDVRTQRMEIMPSAHYFMGGIRISENADTDLPGLYAAGEAAGGIHGANRLSNNSMLETVVFGARAGTSAAEYAKKERFQPIPKEEILFREQNLRKLFGEGSDRSVTEIRRKIQNQMWENMGILRNRAGLEKALKIFAGLQKALKEIRIRERGFKYNVQLISLLEVSGMLNVARLMTTAALHRTESRGAHQREDYSGRDDAQWLCNIVLEKQGDEIRMTRQTVNPSETTR